MADDAGDFQQSNLMTRDRSCLCFAKHLDDAAPAVAGCSLLLHIHPNYVTRILYTRRMQHRRFPFRAKIGQCLTERRVQALNIIQHASALNNIKQLPMATSDTRGVSRKRKHDVETRSAHP